MIQKEYIIHHNGVLALVVNKTLLETQDCQENLERIKELHRYRLQLEDKMHEEGDHKTLKLYDFLYTQLELSLQDAWKFPRNANFHRFWERPKCTCPKLDNEDRYPSGVYVVNLGCPLHGSADD